MPPILSVAENQLRISRASGAVDGPTAFGLRCTFSVDDHTHPRSKAAMSSAQDSIGQRLGDFEIVREIDRGGMGIVYEARQLSLNRAVALKVLPTGLGMTQTARERFHREAQAAAKLHHSHIVAVYAEGEENGVCYYAMELVAGQSLDQLLSANQVVAPTIAMQRAGIDEASTQSSARSSDSNSSGFLSSRARIDTVARWIANAADALDYAHEQGIVHRDVKPSNLMLGDDGRVRLMDFGLARMLEQPGMTMSGEMLGTPRYMSPEQIAAGRIVIDHRTDVYSLGATLYELLTCEPPFSGESRDQIISQIINKEPRRPRQIMRRLPLDLETICLKAIEKDPDRRYQTAGKLANDLRRYLAGDAIGARRVSAIGRAVKWARRRPATAALAGGILAVTMVASLLAFRIHGLSSEQRLERLRSLRETAVVESMSGNFEMAEAAVAEAEEMGESRGWVLMLRGQVALYRHDRDEALRLLRMATEEVPDSVAANAMLTHANLMFEGAYGAYQEGLHRIDQLEFITPEDFIFAGQALAIRDPERGLQLLNRSVKHRKSALGYLISAQLQAMHGWGIGDPKIAEEAVKHATFAQDMLSNHPRACAVKLSAHISAAAAYRITGQQDSAGRHLAQAAESAAVLSTVAGRANAWERLHRGFYLDYVDDVAAFDVFRQEVDQGPTLATKLCIYFLYRQKRYKEGLLLADKSGEKAIGDSLEVSRLYLLAEVEGLDAARQSLQEILARAKTKEILPYYPTLHYVGVLRVLGRNDEADELMARLIPLMQPLQAQTPELVEHSERLLAYCAGTVRDEEFLSMAGTLPGAKLDAHFQIGLRHLSDGNRSKALRHFRAAKECGIPPHFEWYWSWAFARQLEADPLWPSWKPTKVSPQAPTASRADQLVRRRRESRKDSLKCSGPHCRRLRPTNTSSAATFMRVRRHEIEWLPSSPRGKIRNCRNRLGRVGFVGRRRFIELGLR